MLNQIKLINLNKTFLENTVLSNFNYVFTPGCYAITGHNGTGKSTLLKLIVGAETPDSGNIFINEINLLKEPEKAKHCLAYVPDQSFIYPFLTGKEFLKLTMQLRGCSDSQNLENYIGLFGIKNMLNKYFSKMSLGTQKKFMLTSALVHTLPILIMDEPTNGLDKQSRDHLIQSIQSLKKNNIILYASHDNFFMNETSSHIINLNNPIHTP